MKRQEVISIVGGAALLMVWLPPTCAAAEPEVAFPQAIPGAGSMNYLTTSGAVGNAITPLLWGLTVQSIVVVVIITGLVVVAILRHRHWRGATLPPVERPRRGVGWIYVGVALSTIALIGSTGWTVVTMAAIEKPPATPPFTIHVEAQQWWWKLRYDDARQPSRTFMTANEVHIPVGIPVRFEITSGDVIHSFWVPALGGKTDAIPGRVNDTWLEASKAGVYRGQCVEYCGIEHALMALVVYADTPEDFEDWWDRQLDPAATDASVAAREGQLQFIARCGGCHAVRGTLAGGALGPDLTHLMSRSTIAAGTLQNTVANLSGWIANPQGIKPGTLMPNVELTGPELQSIRSYLETLR